MSSTLHAHNRTVSRKPSFKRQITGSLLALSTSACSLLLDFGELETRAECAQCVGGTCRAGECSNNACCAPDAAVPDAGQEPPKPTYERCGPAQSSLDGEGAAPPTLVLGHRLADLKAKKILNTQVLVGEQFLYHVAYVEDEASPVADEPSPVEGGGALEVQDGGGTEREDGGAPAVGTDVVLRAFLLSELKTEPDESVVIDAVRTQRVSAFLPSTSVVRSPGSIALDPMSRVVLYVAHGRAELETALMSRLVFHANLSPFGQLERLTDPPNYRVSAGVGQVGPEAGNLQNGEPFVAWQGCQTDELDEAKEEDLCREVATNPGGSAIYTHTGSSMLDIEYLYTHGVKEPLPVSALQTLSNGVLPAAVWGTSSKGAITITAGVPDVPRSITLRQCDETPDYALTSLHAAATPSGISSLVWSKRKSGAPYITEASSVACGPESCMDYAQLPQDAKCGTPLFYTRVIENVRAAAHDVWVLDPGNSDSSIIVSAKIKELDDAHTRLVVTRTQGSWDPNVSSFLDPRAEETPLAEGTPTGPKVHVQALAHQKAETNYSVVGVGWVEGSAESEVAKLQTFDLCFEP